MSPSRTVVLTLSEAKGKDPGLAGPKLILFSLIAILLPFAALALLEIGLRIGGYGSNRDLFIPAPFDSARYLVPNPKFAARYFPDDPSPPTPPSDAFLRDKPANGFRLFVLGESTTAGFPFPSNGTFSRVLADRLRVTLAHDSVEVINVGIPATNSFTLFDELPEILAQHPDAVLIYAGHNEYYGAMGSASTVRLSASPALVRQVLRLERLRTVLLIQRGIGALRGVFSKREQGTPSLSRMEELAGKDTLRFDGAGYRRGVDQLSGNLDAILARLHHSGVRTYVATLASNLRDQRPFASDSGGVSTNAAAAFAAAHAALSRGDTGAESLFARARDLDLIRFRAPTAFDSVIRHRAANGGAIIVDVNARFRAAATDHIPGSELFFEHVHPRPNGTVLIADAFFDALAADHFLGHQTPDTKHQTPTDEIASMQLTALDMRIASLITDALMYRWPFVARDSGTRYLETFRAATLADSLALAVVTGRITWVQAKLAMAERFESAHDLRAAVAEYRGLIRDQPWNESPLRFAARALIAAGQPSEARPLLEKAYRLGPTAYTCFALATLVRADSGGSVRAIGLLRQSLALGGPNPAVLYQLSLMLGQQGDVNGARATAAQLARVAPSYPGLASWMKLLGGR